MATYKYSSNDVSIAWNGFPFSGFAPDSFLTFSRSVDATDEEIGADRGLAISRNADISGTAELMLQQGTDTESVLTGVMAYDDANNTITSGTLLVSDASGSVLAEFKGSHIKSKGEVDLGSTATGKTRSFVFFVSEMRHISLPVGVPSSAASTAVASGIATIVG